MIVLQRSQASAEAPLARGCLRPDSSSPIAGIRVVTVVVTKEAP
jgi:hypothetical protein